MKTARLGRRAFTLVELLVVVAVTTLVLGLLLPGLSDARRAGRLAVCGANLRQYAAATPAYAADFRDALWAFSWKAHNTLSQYPDLHGAGSDLQAVDILRRRADRPEIPPIVTWIPHPLYSHLVLVDYLSARLPEYASVCPEDRTRVLWRSDPHGFDNGEFQPSPGHQSGPNPDMRLPYSASYQVPTCTYDASPVGSRIEQAAIACDGVILPGNSLTLGGLKLSQVQYPAQKAHVYDRHQRHFSPIQPFFGLARCRQPILAFDGSVVTRFTDQTNPGWQPNHPADPAPTIVEYIPQPWDPPTTSHGAEDLGPGVYRWTRSGLAGVDFRGREISTGQPRP